MAASSARNSSYVRGPMKAPAFAIAPSISSIRSFHSLRGTDRLREDDVPESRMHRLALDDVDLRDAERVLQIVLEPDQIEQADPVVEGRVELDEHVDVALRR